MQDNPYGIIHLLSQSDGVILSVAAVLLIMSLASWSIIILRTWRLYKLRRQARGLHDFWHTQSFTQGLNLLGHRCENNPFRYLAEEGQRALEHHRTCQQDLHGQLPLADWLSSCLKSTIDSRIEQIQKGLAVLASVGATAPFIGLFGTVWGIYHALVSIGASGQVGIEQIAGPVGEALVMTAFGLAVAIPAVLGYNALVRGNKAIVSQLNRFAQQLHTYFLTGSTLTSGKQASSVKALFSERTKEVS